MHLYLYSKNECGLSKYIGKSKLSSKTFTEVPVPSQESERSCICLRRAETNVVLIFCMVSSVTSTFILLPFHTIAQHESDTRITIYPAMTAFTDQYSLPNIFLGYWSVINRTHKCKLRPHRGILFSNTYTKLFQILLSSSSKRLFTI